MTTLCIPTPVFLPLPAGVPRMPNFSGSEGTAYPPSDTDIRDPRWKSSLRVQNRYSITAGSDTTVGGPAYFRAIRDTGAYSGSPHLYLLWHEEVDLAFNPNLDVVMVGFWVGNATGDIPDLHDPNAYGRLFRIIVYGPTADQNTPFSASKDHRVVTAKRYNASASGGTWDSSFTGPSTETPPWWAGSNVVSWRVGTTQADWAVAMRIPLTNTLSDPSDINGVPIPTGGQRIWMVYYTKNSDLLAGTTTGFTEVSSWPQNVDPQVSPAQDKWGLIDVTGTATDCAVGLSIDTWNDILCSHPISGGADTTISRASSDLVGNNQFQVTVHNKGATVDAGKIEATFRIANWGTQAQWQAVSAASSWQQVSSGKNTTDAIPQNGTAVIVGTVPVEGVLQAVATGVAGGTADEHQCILAELAVAPGQVADVIFTTDSGHNNFDFGSASHYQRNGEISVRGQGASGTGSQCLKNVYLYIKSGNMPATTGANGGYLSKLARMLHATRGNIEDPCGYPSLDYIDSKYERLNQHVPNVTIYGFYETDQTVTENGRTFKVLQPMTVCGVYADHNGVLYGWDFSLVGGKRLTENLWLFRVPCESVSTFGLNILAKPTPGATLPHGQEGNCVSFGELCLWANGTMTIADRVEVRGSINGYAPVANAGTGETNIGCDAKVGDAYVRGQLVVRNRGHVYGTAHTDRNPVLQDGPQQISNGVVPVATTHIAGLAFSITFPSGNNGPVSLEPDRQRSIAPGAYSAVSIKSRSTLKLTAGVYTFESFGIEPQARVELDCSAGGVIIHVRGDCFVRGDFFERSGKTIDLFLGCHGTGTVSIERPFRGTLVVPNGTLYLASLNGGSHSGSFFGKNVSIQPGNIITHAPYRGRPRIGL